VVAQRVVLLFVAAGEAGLREDFLETAGRAGLGEGALLVEGEGYGAGLVNALVERE